MEDAGKKQQDVREEMEKTLQQMEMIEGNSYRTYSLSLTSLLPLALSVCSVAFFQPFEAFPMRTFLLFSH